MSTPAQPAAAAFASSPLPADQAVESSSLASLAGLLLTWGRSQGRALPWRFLAADGRRDPYRVWISEIMLQQTQVNTVIPYFARWLTRFPTVEALTAAPLDDVLKAWEGLGYYARARHLHRAAQIIGAQHRGSLPCTVTELIRLPGIGRYTAGAIASLAFGQRAAVLDGNLRRILSRVFDVDTPLGQAAAEARLWALSEALVMALDRDDQAGPLNEAWMDLGAAVCLPTNPACARCPLTGRCLAQARGVQANRPVRIPRKALPYFDVTCGLIWKDDGRLLIAQRPPNGMLGGLWEFPGGKQEPGESLPECLRREIMEELGITIEVGEKLTAVQHTYTHLRITLHAFHCRPLPGVPGVPQAIGVAAWVWARPDELANYAFPVTDLKVIRALQTAMSTDPVSWPDDIGAGKLASAQTTPSS